jgi:MFS family permease
MTATTRAGWQTLIVVSLAQLMSMLDRNILAILNPRIKADLGIGDAEMGLLYGTVFALFYALFSLPLGRLADGWTRTKLLAVCIVFWSLATGLAGFATGFGLLVISRLGVGIGEAATQPAGTSLLFDHFDRNRRGFALAVLSAGLAIGLGLSSVLGGSAADWWDARHAAGSAPFDLRGWQFAFLLAALPGFGIGIALWRLPEPVRGANDGIVSPPDPAPFRASGAVLASVLPGTNWWLMARRGASVRVWIVNLVALVLITVAMIAITRACTAFSPRPPLILAGVATNPHALQWSVVGFGFYVVVNLVQSLKLSDPVAHAVMTGSPTLLLCMGVGSLQSMINYGIMGFTPAFLMKTYALTPTQTGVQFGLLSAALGVIGPLIAGPLSDRLNQRLPGAGRIWVTLISLTLSPLIAVWVYTAPDAGAFYLRFTLYSFILTMWLAPLYAVMFEQVLPRMRAITTAAYLMAMTITGLGIGPYFVGMVSDATGDLSRAILSINVLAPLIVVLLVALLSRAARDTQNLLHRARAAGEAV